MCESSHVVKKSSYNFFLLLSAKYAYLKLALVILETSVASLLEPAKGRSKYISFVLVICAMVILRFESIFEHSTHRFIKTTDQKKITCMIFKAQTLV